MLLQLLHVVVHFLDDRILVLCVLVRILHLILALLQLLLLLVKELLQCLRLHAQELDVLLHFFFINFLQKVVHLGRKGTSLDHGRLMAEGRAEHEHYLVQLQLANLDEHCPPFIHLSLEDPFQE